MSELNDVVKCSASAVARDHEAMAAVAHAAAQEHAMQLSAQLSTAENLKKLQQQFEESQRKQEEKDREQAKEDRINRFYNLIAILIAAASMLISLIK